MSTDGKIRDVLRILAEAAASQLVRTDAELTSKILAHKGKSRKLNILESSTSVIHYIRLQKKQLLYNFETLLL